MAQETRSGLSEAQARIVYNAQNMPGSNATIARQSDGSWTVTWSPQPAGAAPVAAAAGAVAKLTPADFDAAARTLGPGVSAAIVRAFAEVESGGKSGFGADGRPVIAYEGHTFRKLTGAKYDAGFPLLSYPYKVKAGPEWQQNNKNQETAWATLAKAMALDASAAQQACSWGMFQVMGFNYQTCGYATVDAFVAAMKAGEAGQLQAFVGFCKAQRGMVAALAARDFQKMATIYNGADYGDYDKRIERAYKRYGGT